MASLHWKPKRSRRGITRSERTEEKHFAKQFTIQNDCHSNVFDCFDEIIVRGMHCCVRTKIDANNRMTSFHNWFILISCSSPHSKFPQLECFNFINLPLKLIHRTQIYSLQRVTSTSTTEKNMKSLHAKKKGEKKLKFQMFVTWCIRRNWASRMPERKIARTASSRSPSGSNRICVDGTVSNIIRFTVVSLSLSASSEWLSRCQRE